MADAPSIALTVPSAPVASLQVAPDLSVGFQSVTAGVYSVNDINGYLMISGVDSIAVRTSGKMIIISGDIPSGYVSPGQLEATGRAAWTAGQNNALNLSGNLYQTGATLVLMNNAVATNLFATGSTLSNTIEQTGQQAWSAAQNNSTNLSGTVAATGQQAWSAADNNGRNLSGTIASSGQQAWSAAQNNAVNLSGQLASTGQQAWSAAQNNAVNISGNLTQTGVQLVASIAAVKMDLIQTGSMLFLLNSGLSGQIGLDYATKSSLASTGQQAWIASQNNAINLSGNISGLSGAMTLTGQALFARDLATSGELSNRIVTSGAILMSIIDSTGTQVWYIGQNNATNLSGSIAATGQQAWLAANNNARNLSGNLTLTGQTAQNNALNLSGSLFATGANLSAVKVTGSAVIQVPNFIGIGGALIIQSGNSVVISGETTAAGIDHGDGRNLSGNLTLTGQTLVNAIASTGQQAWSAAQNNSLNLSGNLTQTGASLGSRIDTLTTNLYTTGSTLYGLTAGLSGQSALDYATKTSLASTGQQAWSAANNNGINLSGNISAVSGNLTLTGQTLIARDFATSGELSSRMITSGAIVLAAVAWTGQQLWDISQSNALNLSGNLVTTGANLSAIKVTGSSIIQVANFSGLGGTLVIRSGGFVLISGAAGGSVAGVDHGDGINLSGQLALTGQTLIALNLSTSGALDAKIAASAAGVATLNTLSGAINIAVAGSDLLSTAVSGQTIFVSGRLVASTTGLAATGQQAWAAADNNARNLSGNLASTGSILSSALVTFSGTMQMFSVGVPTGVDILTVNYPQPFASTPNVTASITSTGYILYLMSYMNITPTGYTAHISDVVLESGVSIYTFAKLP